MGLIYLISDGEKYKIGVTTSEDVGKRLKQLQTGCSNELMVKDLFESKHPFKLEKMLHNRFKYVRLIGEWFSLSERDTEDFKGICEQYETIIDSLKNNPFYFKK